MRLFLDTANIRRPRHVTEAACAGAPIATVPYAVLRAMLRHPLTDVGIERFTEDARRYRRDPSRESAKP